MGGEPLVLSSGRQPEEATGQVISAKALPVDLERPLTRPTAYVEPR